MTHKLVDAIAGMCESEALQIAADMLEAGEDPEEILALCRDAMSIVGDLFEKKECFLPELVLAGKMLSQIAELVKPMVRSESSAEDGKAGTVVIGTVQGDIHDLGKNMVIFMLEVNGFKVHDLGVDVPVQSFVEAIDEVNPDVLGLSGFLTVSFDALKKTVEGIKRAGIRDQVKIMIGGGMVDEHIRAYAAADAYGSDAMAAVSLVKKWIGKD